MTMKSIKNLFAGFIYGNRPLSVLRIVMGLLFIYSGFFKALDPVAFGRIIELYKVLPSVLIPYAAVVLPYLELLIGMFLVTGLKIRAASFLSMGLMAVFAVAISINVVRGASFECGCFETQRFGMSEKIGIPLIARDIVFFILFYVIFIAKKHYYSLDTVIEKDELYTLK